MFHSGRLPVRAGFLAAALAVLPAATANAAETAYPLTIKSCGHDITFRQPPARAVYWKDTQAGRTITPTACCRNRLL